MQTASEVIAEDRIYFPARESVRNVLIQHINAETIRLDISSWYFSDRTISRAVAARFVAGVRVRIIGDRAAPFENDGHTKAEYYWLANQGVPIRMRVNPSWFPEIDHWKMMLFAGQGIVAFGSANITPAELVPSSSTNYVDNTMLVSSDPALVNAFRTKFDVMWQDVTREPQSIAGPPPYLKNWDEACATEHTGACADYRTLYPNPAPMLIDTARLEPDYPTPPDLVWGQGPEFNNRLIQEILTETTRIDVALFRLEVSNVTDALISRFRAGVPVRVIVDPAQYTNLKFPEYWLTHANIDKLWAAGVPVKSAIHQGGMHMKMLVTSRYATNASANFGPNWQRDHNYFVPAATKPAIYGAMANEFDRMWRDAAGFAPFVPTAPRAATLFKPQTNATAVIPNESLMWNRAPLAVSYDVYVGKSPSSLQFAANVPAKLTTDPPLTYSWTPSSLQEGTKYYWKVVSRTNATAVSPLLVASSTVWSFTTRGVPADFDGDGGTDVAVFRPSTGFWYVRYSGATTTGGEFRWGGGGDVPVPADYDGDSRSDVAVFRPATGHWLILRSGANFLNWSTYQWGGWGDTPVPGDYDGDGRNDLAVYRPSSGVWFILRSSGNFTAGAQYAWGHGDDQPVPGDYDGDRRTDVAVYRPSSGHWFILRSSDNYRTWLTYQWGTPGDAPVQKDYDGDGTTDIAIYRPSTGMWFILTSASRFTAGTGYTWGVSGDIPVPGDYDRDGKADPTIYRPSTGYWFILQSGHDYIGSAIQWGTTGDVPLIQSP